MNPSLFHGMVRRRASTPPSAVPSKGSPPRLSSSLSSLSLVSPSHSSTHNLNNTQMPAQIPKVQKAVVFDGPNAPIRVVTDHPVVQQQDLKPGEALVNVTYTGVCHTGQFSARVLVCEASSLTCRSALRQIFTPGRETGPFLPRRTWLEDTREPVTLSPSPVRRCCSSSSRSVRSHSPRRPLVDPAQGWRRCRNQVARHLLPRLRGVLQLYLLACFRR